jgi:DNA invertase Pin-like site-specific DNA recombinase
MMQLQKINDITYVNGIRLETETIPIEEIEDSLKIIKEDMKLKELQEVRLRERRDEIIVHARKHGFSAIKIASILDVTRQTIYDVLKNMDIKNEEE